MKQAMFSEIVNDLVLGKSFQNINTQGYIILQPFTTKLIEVYESSGYNPIPFSVTNEILLNPEKVWIPVDRDKVMSMIKTNLFHGVFSLSEVEHLNLEKMNTYTQIVRDNTKEEYLACFECKHLFECVINESNLSLCKNIEYFAYDTENMLKKIQEIIPSIDNAQPLKKSVEKLQEMFKPHYVLKRKDERIFYYTIQIFAEFCALNNYYSSINWMVHIKSILSGEMSYD